MIIRFDYDSGKIMIGTEPQFKKWDKGELNSGVAEFTDLNLYKSVPLVIEVVNAVVHEKEVILQEQSENVIRIMERY